MDREKVLSFLPAILALIYGASFLAWLLMPGTAAQYLEGIYIFQAGTALLATCLSLDGFRILHKRGSPLRWVSLLLSIGLLLNFVGQALAAAFAMPFLAHSPLSYLPDILYLLGYPFFLGSVLLFPSQRLSAAIRARLAADGIMIILALVTFSWYFIIGPNIVQAQGSFVNQLLGAAYPATDLVLLCCLVLIYTKQSNISRGLFLLLALLSAGLILFVLTDSIDAYIILHDLPKSVLENVGWSLGYLLLGIAWQVSRFHHELEGRTIVENSSWTRAFLPYSFVIAVLLLMGYIWSVGKPGFVENGAYLCGLLLIAVVLLRQVFAMKTVQETNARLEELATTDLLTHLPNHGTLAELLEQEVERTQHYRRSFALLFMDIDHFKALNDGFGHAAGDTVLHEFAAVVRGSLRKLDTLGRWGGEEFVALLPELSVEEGLIVAERVRAAVNTHSFRVGGGSHVTCSVGLACLPLHAQTPDALMSAADAAMYGAKRLGRNQVRVANDPAVLALLNVAHADNRAGAALAGTVEVLVALTGVRDHLASAHSHHVGELLLKVAGVLGLDDLEAQMLALAGQLHDIGKIAIPEAILQKREKLTAAEWQCIQTHPMVGADLVSNIPALRPLAPIIRSHHEHWDGRGYPDQLAGTQIPQGARVLAVVNAYLAMLESRPYRLETYTPTEALAELRRCAGTQFDPHVVATILEVLEQEQQSMVADQELISI